MFDFSIIGLTGRDKRVYEALRELGDASIRAIAERIGINRGSVHESLGELSKAGLVGYVAYGERRRYVAQDPRLLEQLLQEKKTELQRAEHLVEPYAQFLQQKESVGIFGSLATMYEGDEGLAAILRDVISTLSHSDTKEYQVISSPNIRQYLYHNFPHFTRERIRHQLYVNVIGVGDTATSINELAERRIMSASSTEALSCYTILYADKTAFLSLGETNQPQGIVVHNAGITALQRELFWRLWTACSE